MAWLMGIDAADCTVVGRLVAVPVCVCVCVCVWMRAWVRGCVGVGVDVVVGV